MKQWFKDRWVYGSRLNFLLLFTLGVVEVTGGVLALFSGMFPLLGILSIVFGGFVLHLVQTKRLNDLHFWFAMMLGLGLDTWEALVLMQYFVALIFGLFTGVAYYLWRYYNDRLDT